MPRPTLSSALLNRLAHLREDYAEAAGAPFLHFFCPVLFRDEDVELCRAHVINEGFAGADRSWTVQRKDVDAFFGSMFEADFLLLEHRGEISLIDAIADPHLARGLRAHVRVKGEKVEHYFPTASIPGDHTPMMISAPEREVKLALKLTPSEVLDSASKGWEIGIERDLRLPVLASILKCAHLTLFHIAGYRYALSAAGHFMGRTILGDFFASLNGQPKATVLQAAAAHFEEFQNIARPVEQLPDSFKGTLTDRRLFVLKTDAWPWAMLVLLRTGKSRHAVLVPVFENHHAIARYLRFMRHPEREFDAHLTEFTGDSWSIATTPQRFRWPDARFSS